MSASTEYSNSGEYQRRQDETNAGPSRSSSHSHSRQHSDGYHQVSASASTSRTFQDDHGHGHNLSSGPGGEESRHQDERRHSSFSATSPPPRKSASLSRPKSHHLDIATFPTQQLLRLIAGLLQHIASANDALRPDPSEDQEGIEDEGGDPAMTSGNGHSTRESSKSRSRSHSRASHTSSATHPSSSPTTALFEHRRPDGMIASDSVSASRSVSPNLSASTPALNSPDFPLFSASRSSLSHPSSLLAFHARHIPSISVEAYLLRILKYCPTTNEVFLGLLVYFDRMTRLGTPAGVGGENAGVAKGKGFAIDSYNIHRLVIAGVTVASKFFSDVFYTNSRYAKVGGLPSTELNSLELQFLLLNDFRLRISLDEMQRYGDRLLAYAAEEDEREREAWTSRARALKGDLGGAGPSIEDAHSASQAVATSEIVNGRSKVSHHGSTDRTEQTSIPQPASTVQPSQPALAPDHPSEANSAPITRQTSNTSATAVLSQHHKSQPSHSQTYPPPTTSAPVPSIGSIGSTAKPGKLDSESSRSGSSEWVNVVGEGQ
ncbi:hypothetical protein I316_03716 [Kwoniella heveanensis BCC8398]|uniref:Glycogen storage control protein n=1 Tax=Kwoniella heveanensis BCC8398 TaxID=1296120 RepID=A0A1B9GUD4_9TREE|nr:hypothetical protein I316_03716 [Kwoniella heveanensis BCC8398]